MDGLPHSTATDPTFESVGARLAALLSGQAEGLRDPSGSDLEFVDRLEIRPLQRAPQPGPPDLWAVDGGQALIADARCLQVYVARAARVRWRDGACVLEEPEPLQAYLFGLGEERRAAQTLRGRGAPLATDAVTDINLVRDWLEWASVASSVAAAEPGGLVLVDGDLQPDWRIPSTWLSDLLRGAAAREVVVAGITKHTSLSWGGAPLLSRLEPMADDLVGPRGCWWAPVGFTRPDVGPGLQVVVARLDPDARFAFRVDLPAGVDAAGALASLCAVSDDAAFPGYPYPLSVADRLAACPPHVRDDAWSLIDAQLERSGIPPDVRERAFADRHRLMERG